MKPEHLVDARIGKTGQERAAVSRGLETSEKQDLSLSELHVPHDWCSAPQDFRITRYIPTSWS